MLQVWQYAVVPLSQHCLHHSALCSVVGKWNTDRMPRVASMLGTEKVELISEVLPTEILQKLWNKLCPEPLLSQEQSCFPEQGEHLLHSRYSNWAEAGCCWLASCCVEHRLPVNFCRYGNHGLQRKRTPLPPLRVQCKTSSFIMSHGQGITHR